MTLGQLVYINNRVLLPRLEYCLQYRLLSENMCIRLYRPMIVMIKNKVNIAKSLATSIVTHRNLIGAKTFWQNQILYHFTKLAVRLNDNSAVGQTTWIRLMQSQLRYKCT